MYQIDVSTAVSTQPTSTALGTPGYFTDGNAALGQAATVVPAEFLNSIMLELVNTITGAGLTLSKSSFNQLYTAIRALSQGGGATYAVDIGSANTYQVAYTPAITAVVDGMKLRFKAKTANTGASTFSPNGLTASPIYSGAHAALLGGEIVANSDVEVVWNSSLNGGNGAWVLLESTGGVLEAATPSLYDNSAKLATMAALAGAGVRFSSFGSISGTYSLALTDLPKIIAVQANGQTITLPPTTDQHIGAVQRLFIYPGSSNTVTVQGSGVQQVSTPTTLGASVVVSANGFTDFIWEGTATQHWEVSGAGVMDKIPAFGSSLATSGYQKLPSGLIIQWGSCASVNANTLTTFNYPLAFPNSVLQFLCSAVNNGTSPAPVQGLSISNTQYQMVVSSGNETAAWIAIGK